MWRTGRLYCHTGTRASWPGPPSYSPPSRDGFLPAWVSKLHPRYGTPFAFILSAIGVFVLRYKMPEVVRPFRCPAIGLVAPLAVIMCAVLMVSLPWETWLRFILWFYFGLIIYFGYDYSHSNLNKERASEMLNPK